MGRRVLVVDDEPDIVYMVKVILRSAGCEVTTAAGVAEATSMLAVDDPDLILLDLRLADGDGMEVLDAMRSSGKIDSIPVIILSAHATPSTSEKALAAGAKGYITKPFIAGQLVDAVNQHLGSA
jgi:two-component system, OmpR family, KDP operon response regulator KdpE